MARVVSLVNFVVFGIEIALDCDIGAGLYLPHTQGTVIGAWRLGRNVTVYQGVTLGAKELDFSFDGSRRPVVEDDVTIGAGAKVLGPVTLRFGSRVGANAVVLEDVPEGALAVGVPARIAGRPR
jgi:serine O-acetyltransferase